MLTFMLNGCGCDTTNFCTLRLFETLLNEFDQNTSSSEAQDITSPRLCEKQKCFIAERETTIGLMLKQCEANECDFPTLTMFASLLENKEDDESKSWQRNKDELKLSNNATRVKNITQYINNITNKSDIITSDSMQQEKLTEEQNLERPPARNGTHNQAEIRLSSHLTSQNEADSKIDMLANSTLKEKKETSICDQVVLNSNNIKDYVASINYEHRISRDNKYNLINKNNRPFTKPLSKYADKYLRSLYDRRAESEDVNRLTQGELHLRNEVTVDKRKNIFNINKRNMSNKNSNNENNNNKKELHEEELENVEGIDISNVSAIQHDTSSESLTKANKEREVVHGKNTKNKSSKHHARITDYNSHDKGNKINKKVNVFAKNYNNNNNINNNNINNNNENEDKVNEQMETTPLNLSSSSISSPQPSKPEQESLLMSQISPSSLALMHACEMDANGELESQVASKRIHRSAIAHLLHLTACRERLANNKIYNVVHILPHTPVKQRDYTNRCYTSQSRPSICTEVTYNSKNNAMLLKKKESKIGNTDGSLPRIYNRCTPCQLSVSPAQLHSSALEDNHVVNDTYNIHKSEITSSECEKQKADLKRQYLVKIEKETQRFASANEQHRHNNVKLTAKSKRAKEQHSLQGNKPEMLLRPRSTSQNLAIRSSSAHAKFTYNKNKNMNRENNNMKKRESSIVCDSNDNKQGANRKEPDLMIIGSTIHFSQFYDKPVKEV